MFSNAGIYRNKPAYILTARTEGARSMEQYHLYKDIQARTNGEIYIYQAVHGRVGPAAYGRRTRKGKNKR